MGSPLNWVWSLPEGEPNHRSGIPQTVTCGTWPANIHRQLAAVRVGRANVSIAGGKSREFEVELGPGGLAALDQGGTIQAKIDAKLSRTSHLVRLTRPADGEADAVAAEPRSQAVTLSAERSDLAPDLRVRECPISRC